jgi:hypothetical protein
METSEVEKHVDDFEKTIGIEEYLLKYPVDILLDFNIDNIKDKLKDNVAQVYKFEIRYLKAKAKYDEIMSLFDEVRSEQFDWYKFEYDKSLSTLEIKEFYIHKDPKVKKLKRLLDKQNIQKNFFKLCLRSFINQGTRMHDFIKVLELNK